LALRNKLKIGHETIKKQRPTERDDDKDEFAASISSSSSSSSSSSERIQFLVRIDRRQATRTRSGGHAVRQERTRVQISSADDRPARQLPVGVRAETPQAERTPFSLRTARQTVDEDRFGRRAAEMS